MEEKIFFSFLLHSNIKKFEKIKKNGIFMKEILVYYSTSESKFLPIVFVWLK